MREMRDQICAFAFAIAFGAAIAGCTGVVGSGDAAGNGSTAEGNGAAVGGAGTPSGSTGATGGAMSAGDPNAAGTMPLQHLSQIEYLNTVSDLLQDTSLTASQLPPDFASDPDSLAFPEPDIVGTLAASQYHDAAKQLAANVKSKLATFLPCNVSADTACATQFVTEFLPKAYRRPVTPAEIGDYTTLYQAVRGAPLTLSIADAFGLVVSAILQSPGFLYHWELDPTAPMLSGSVVQLDPYTIANRLSYFLVGSMPDATLFAAAANGTLASPDTVAAQARRLLASPGARVTVENFFDDWLNLSLASTQPKDPDVYPAFQSAEVKAAAQDEAHNFVTSIVIDGSGSFSELFTSNASTSNQYLAPLYGTAPRTGAALQPVTLDPTQRGGILTSVAFLAATGGADGDVPPRRGKAIVTRLLCETLGNPPNVIPTPVLMVGTTRQKFEEHDKLACTQGCHNVIEPYGFAFEHFDGIGQYRMVEHIDPANPSATLPVDSTTTVTVDGQAHAIQDAIGLGQVLAHSQQVYGCFATQWLRYAVGRVDTPDDQASINQALGAFAAAQYNVRDLIVALVTSRTFRYRTPAAGEVLQ
jgi:hypothetical protein